ncbi:hypothetical protein ACXZ65_34560 [Streptomyces aculeolatus]
MNPHANPKWPDFASIARTLNAVAEALESRSHLDPDAAVRMVIWGTPKAHVPDRETTDSLLYSEVVTAIEGYDANKNGYECGNGIDRLDRRAAIAAALQEAARFRSYSGG